jgi:hypothetical protein
MILYDKDLIMIFIRVSPDYLEAGSNIKNVHLIKNITNIEKNYLLFKLLFFTWINFFYQTYDILWILVIYNNYYRPQN